jgi:hypothetical protein
MKFAAQKTLVPAILLLVIACVGLADEPSKSHLMQKLVQNSSKVIGPITFSALFTVGSDGRSFLTLIAEKPSEIPTLKFREIEIEGFIGKERIQLTKAMDTQDVFLTIGDEASGAYLVSADPTRGLSKVQVKYKGAIFDLVFPEVKP